MMIEPVIVQHMVAEAMGIDFTNVAVCIQQGWLQAVIAGAALVVGAVAQYQSNKAAKKAAKEQAELAKKQAAFNKNRAYSFTVMKDYTGSKPAKPWLIPRKNTI